MRQLSEVVMDAVKKIAGDGGYVTLPQVQACPQVGDVIRSSSRVTDVMGELEGRHQVRLVATHPVRTWAVVRENVQAEEENRGL